MKKKTKKSAKARQVTRKRKAAGGIIQESPPNLPYYDQLQEFALKSHLAKKVMAVAEKCQGFETMGTGEEEGGENLQFGYTTAEQVFRTYGQLFREHGLWWRPIDTKIEIAYRMVFAVCTFELVDVDTGYSVQFSGAGSGSNGVWAVNSSQTVCLKQALLETLMAYWVEAEDIARKKVDYFSTFKGLDKPEQVGEILQQMKDFFEASLNSVGRIKEKAGIPDKPKNEKEKKNG